MTTTETFAALYATASDAVRQRLADVVLGAAIAQGHKDGHVPANPASDSDDASDPQSLTTSNHTEGRQ